MNGIRNVVHVDGTYVRRYKISTTLDSRKLLIYISWSSFTECKRTDHRASGTAGRFSLY